MKINGTRPDLLRSDVAREAQRAGAEKTGKPAAAQPPAAVDRSDRVQISDAGRALAAQVTTPVKSADEALTPEHVAEIRHRVLSGAYNSLDVVDQVARRMLATGDI